MNTQILDADLNQTNIKPMSKKSTSNKNPELYSDLTAPKKEHSIRKIVIDELGKIHAFKDESVVVPADIKIKETYLNFDKFSDLPPTKIAELHGLYFTKEIPKKQNHVITASWIWAYMIKHATPHLQGTNTVTGEKERKSSNATRGYRITEKKTSETDLKTYQAIQCYKILSELLIELNKTSVTEEELKQTVIRRQAELKTKQDPWRIFQYYRPKLVSLGLIKHD